MFRWLLTKIARRMNPDFTINKDVSGSMIRSYAWTMGKWWVRSWLLILRGRYPRMLFLGPGVRISHLRNVQLGRFVRIHEGALLSGLGRKKLTIGEYTRIGAYSRVVISETFDNPGEYISIGKRVGIHDFAHIGGGGGVEIGDDTIIGAYFSCHPEGHIFDDPSKPIRLQGLSRKGIKIGKGCWIGAKVTVLDGVEIGDNSVIAAGAVVTQSFPKDSIIAGVPAKLIRTISSADSLQ